MISGASDHFNVSMSAVSAGQAHPGGSADSGTGRPSLELQFSKLLQLSYLELLSFSFLKVHHMDPRVAVMSLNAWKQSTLKLYDGFLSHFKNFISLARVTEVSFDSFSRFLVFCKTKKNLSPATVKSITSGIQVLLKWLFPEITAGVDWNQNSLRILKRGLGAGIQRSHPSVGWSLDEVLAKANRVVMVSNGTSKDFESGVAKTLILCLLATGFRISRTVVISLAPV